MTGIVTNPRLCKEVLTKDGPQGDILAKGIWILTLTAGGKGEEKVK